MSNPELREMIDLATATRIIEGVALAAVVVAALLVCIGLASPHRRLQPLLWAAALAPWAVALPLAWRVYLRRVCYNPATGFVGLHSVGVLLENLLFAAVAGVAYGFYLRWLWGLPESTPKDQFATRED